MSALGLIAFVVAPTMVMLIGFVGTWLHLRASQRAAAKQTVAGTPAVDEARRSALRARLRDRFRTRQHA